MTFIEAQAESEEERNSLAAHFTAAQMSVHTKKPVKGADLYRGRKGQAELRKAAERRKAVEQAAERLKGKTMSIHPKIAAKMQSRKKQSGDKGA